MELFIYGLGAVASIFLLVLAALDVFWPFTVILVITTIGIWSFGKISLSSINHPVLIAGYLVAGLLWIAFRWVKLVENELKYAKQYPAAKKAPPTFSEHTTDFMAYFFYWPVDLFVYLIRDVLVDLWELVSKMVSQSFNRYAAWRFKKEGL